MSIESRSDTLYPMNIVELNKQGLTAKEIKHVRAAARKGVDEQKAISRAKWFAAKWKEAKAALGLSEASVETIVTN